MKLEDYIIDKPVITTDRLILRPLRSSDIPTLLEWMPDKSMYKYWGKQPGKADKDPAQLFAHEEEPTKSFHWGVEFEGKIVGELWVYLIEGNRMAKMALRIAPAYQHKGIATEATKLAVDFCFGNTELKRLWTDVDVRNEPSIRVLEKAGFRREGMIRQGKMVSTWCDYYIYGLLDTDWESSRKQVEGI